MEIANRGVHMLAIDGPGQGEALRLQGIPSRYDYEVPGSAAYEYVAGRPDVDPERVGVMGFSMGGYYAPRIAAFEKRYKACVAWGAHFDYHATWVTRRREMESGGTKVTSAKFHLPWVLGVPDMDAAMKKLENYRLEGVAGKIDCPILITHGECDTIVPVAMAHKLYESGRFEEQDPQDLHRRGRRRRAHAGRQSAHGGEHRGRLGDGKPVTGYANTRRRYPAVFDQLNPGVGEADRLDLVFEDLLFTEESIYDDFAVLDRDLRDIFHDRLLSAGRV